MSIFTRPRFLQRLRALVFRREAERELDREITSHVALLQDDFERSGLSAEQARRAARLRLGGIDQTKERHRDVRSFRWLEDLRRDVPYALRGLRRSPGFALTAIFTLALGIGATTAIYSVVSTILLTPLPYPDSDRLVRFSERGMPDGRRTITYGEFVEWRARTTTMSAMVATAWGPQTLMATPSGTARLAGGNVSPEWFELLGTRAMLGRTLMRGDGADGRGVMVLTARAWRQHFGADPQLMGRAVTIGKRAVEIIGVMPDGFEDPTGTFDYWTPFPSDARRGGGVVVIGRLAPGVTVAAAEAEATSIGTALRAAAAAVSKTDDYHHLPKHRQTILTGIKAQMIEPVTSALRVLLAAVGVVLLIVCANVASLLLARGTARHREMAVRLAIGAGRGRIIRQLLAESLVLSLCGGLLGAGVAALGIATIKTLATIDAPGVFRIVMGGSLLPRVDELAVDLRVALLAVGLSVVTSLIFGLAPALQLSRADHLQVMNTRAAPLAGGEHRLRSLLVVGQLVMATVLLVGAGLLAHSFLKLSRVDTGYDAAHVLAFQLVLPQDYPTARKTAVIEHILNGLRATPGVQAAGFSYSGAFVGITNTVGYFVPPGRTADEMHRDPDKPRLRSVSHGYLTAMGVRLREGRDFSARDDAAAPWVAVINRRAARKYFGEASAVGATLIWHGPDEGGVGPVPVEVIGVMDDVRNARLDREPIAEVLLDYRQLIGIQTRWKLPASFQEMHALGFMSFAARATGDPAAIGQTVRAVVHDADPNAGIDAMTPLEQLKSTSIAQPRFYAVMLGIFAAVAGVLAAVGIYGVLAYAVLQRTQEIGVRMALGAQPRAVLALVLRRGFLLTGIGIALGLAGAAALSRVLRTLLFDLTPLDPITYVAVAAGFTLIATLAAYLPARRATRVDPVVALRCE